jgi:IS30 family transposase
MIGKTSAQRNEIDGKYSPFKAQLAYQERKKKCGAKNILKGSILLIDIQDKLEGPWTPEQIAGRAKLEKLYNISFKTIYRAIEAKFLPKDVVKLLPRKGKVKKNGVEEKRGAIPDKKAIEERRKKQMIELK